MWKVSFAHLDDIADNSEFVMLKHLLFRYSKENRK